MPHGAELCAKYRHFITSYYPVLQYHNTELELNINKVVDTEPAQLTILKSAWGCMLLSRLFATAPCGCM